MDRPLQRITRESRTVVHLHQANPGIHEKDGFNEFDQCLNELDNTYFPRAADDHHDDRYNSCLRHIKDSYPLPRMDECIDSLGEATIFTTLDAYSGYWQMPVRESDRHKTAFVCHAGTYQYTRMPFGLTNAPASFQRALDFILTKYKWKTCLVYLDDVIIYSKSVEDHIRHVDEILECLAAAGVTLKMKKCKFFTTTVEYLGHIIKPGKLEVDQANTESLRKAQPPTNRSELRSFLGFCNVYRRFIKDFTRLAGPINKLLKKNSPDQFILDEEQLKAFRALIDCVTHPPVLGLPISGLKYSVDTDASAYGMPIISDP